jgi:hypothetical protein
MEIKILGIHDALKLASIIAKYVENIQPEQDAVDFIAQLVGKLTPQEYLSCVTMMTDKTEEDIQGWIGVEILAAFIEGLKANQILSLLAFYKSLGF